MDSVSGDTGDVMGGWVAFLDMGGYAAYVWPAWGVTVLVLVGLTIATVRAVRRNEAELALLQATMPQRQRRNRRTDGAVDGGSRDDAA